ncbi:MAG: hypothetical protein ACLTBV_20605 [Enterocloster bolteae]
MDSEFVTKVGEMEGTEKVLPLYDYKNQMVADGVILSRLEATGNLEWYNSMMALHHTDKEMEEQALLALPGKTILWISRAADRITFCGDTIDFDLPGRTILQKRWDCGSFRVKGHGCRGW